MGEATGIAWTDSTANFWEGCTKVGPGCDHCYAETRDKRYHDGVHWGAGAPRRQMSQHTRNNALRWERQAPAFLAEHGHPRRVFCSSLSDIFDNEVPNEWRQEAFAIMEETPSLRWQLLTKRIGNVDKMVPPAWRGDWPRHVGVMATVVTQPEFERDAPKLEALKRAYDLPWVGLSAEPLLEPLVLYEMDGDWLDWIVVGGESGPGAREFKGWWATYMIEQCERIGVSCFVKQMGANYSHGGAPKKLRDKAGADISEWPSFLRVRQFPRALCL